MTDQSNSHPLRRPRFVIAAAIVALLIVIAVIVTVTNVVGGAKPAATAQPTAAKTSAPPSGVDADSSPSTCGLSGYSKTSTLTSLPKTTWQLVGTMAAPNSKSFGPGIVTDNGFRSCYQHTAEGALFFASNFLALGTDQTMQKQLLGLVAPGRGHDAIAAKPATGSTASTRAQIAGFKVDSYDGKNTTVEVVLNYSSGTLAAVPIKLTWLSGDWKLILADDGTMPIAPSALDNLGGYTPWSGA